MKKTMKRFGYNMKNEVSKVRFQVDAWKNGKCNVLESTEFLRKYDMGELLGMVSMLHPEEEIEELLHAVGFELQDIDHRLNKGHLVRIVRQSLLNLKADVEKRVYA